MCKFSKFSTTDTIEFFEKIGIKTYVQEDMRIFPVSNSSADVREKFLNSLKKVKFIKDEVLKINREAAGFSVITKGRICTADYIIISTGGHAGYEPIKMLGHNIIEPKPALVGLKTKEDFSNLAGVSINGVLFTHKGISGPEVYKISSLKARDDFPYKLNFNFIGDIDLQSELNSNPHKSIKNLLSDYVPKSFALYCLKGLKINPDEKCHLINGKTRDMILNRLLNFEVTVTGVSPEFKRNKSKNYGVKTRSRALFLRGSHGY